MCHDEIKKVKKIHEAVVNETHTWMMKFNELISNTSNGTNETSDDTVKTKKSKKEKLNVTFGNETLYNETFGNETHHKRRPKLNITRANIK